MKETGFEGLEGMNIGDINTIKEDALNRGSAQGRSLELVYQDKNRLEQTLQLFDRTATEARAAGLSLIADALSAMTDGEKCTIDRLFNSSGGMTVYFLKFISPEQQQQALDELRKLLVPKVSREVSAEVFNKLRSFRRKRA